MGTCALIAIPGFSGFFSKEAILDAALTKNPVFFWVGAAVAALTTFYMARLCLVAFLGEARAHGAAEAREAGPTMLLPLLILSIMAIISGYGFVADGLVPYEGFHAHGFALGLPFYVSMGSLVIGLLLAWAVYGLGKRRQDPLAGNALSTALRKRLYIDDVYDKGLIGFLQGNLARAIELFDNAILHGICTQGAGWLTGRFGKLLTWFQGGILRRYSVVAALGALLFLFLIVSFSFTH